MNRDQLTRRGVTLVEVVLSIAIVGGLLVSVMSVVGVTAQRSLLTSRQSRAAWLARDLSAEIASRPCAFNTGADIVVISEDFALDSGDPAPLDRGGALALDNRKAFNDIFDYDNWTSTPPVDMDGIPIPGFDGWTRNVDVDAINPLTLETRAFDPACARVSVVVSIGNTKLHTEYTIRSAATDTLRTSAAVLTEGAAVK